MFESIPIEPDPVNGLMIRNSVNSPGIPKTLKIGDAIPEIMEESPLACNNSTIEKIATK